MYSFNKTVSKFLYSFFYLTSFFSLLIQIVGNKFPNFTDKIKGIYSLNLGKFSLFKSLGQKKDRQKVNNSHLKIKFI
jgi:hypothetical protein